MAVVNFYNYMWLKEDLKSIVSGKDQFPDFHQFIHMAESGQLTLFIQAMSAVLQDRARVNHIHEFYSTISGDVSTVMDQLDYDIIQKDAQMTERVKYNAKTIDGINQSYNNAITQLSSFYDASTKNLTDNYQLYMDFSKNRGKNLMECINPILKDYGISEIESIDELYVSTADARKAMYDQLSADTKTLEDELNSALAADDPAIKYFMYIAVAHILSHVLKNQMAEHNINEMQIFKDSTKHIIKKLSEAVSQLKQAEKSVYKPIDTASLQELLSQMEGMKAKASDTYATMKQYPQKKSKDQDDNQLDLDELVDKENK